jgi:ATP-dependent RNA helicase RhlE
MKFKDFPIEPELKKSLQSMGFRKPTDIQYKSIPPILRGEDVLAVAQTGTGKTAAFAIPVINLLHRRKRSRRSEGVRCVVMVPTHELATQLTDVFQEIGKHSKVKTFGIFGGVEQDPQIAQLQRGIDVLVATPGRLFDLASQGHLDLRQVEILILDEADRMLALGFYKDIQDLIKKLPRKRQTLFFSATIDKKIKKLAYALVNSKAIRIQISPEDPVSKNVEHSVFFAEMDEKRFFLERLVKEQEGKKILVFVRTKVRAERVVKAMERVKIESKSLHGDKDQKDRQAVLDSFREGKLKLLIATDVSARGIDIPGVDFVVNYDLPEQSENYVHRVGRTGRGRNKGQAVSFCSSGEQKLLEQIEQYIGKPIDRLELSSTEREETHMFFGDSRPDWRKLMEEGD